MQRTFKINASVVDDTWNNRMDMIFGQDNWNLTHIGSKQHTGIANTKYDDHLTFDEEWIVTEWPGVPLRYFPEQEAVCTDCKRTASELEPGNELGFSAFYQVYLCAECAMHRGE